MKGHATLIGNTPITKYTNHVLNTSLDKLNYGIEWYCVPTTVRKGPSLLEAKLFTKWKGQFCTFGIRWYTGNWNRCAHPGIYAYPNREMDYVPEECRYSPRQAWWLPQQGIYRVLQSICGYGSKTVFVMGLYWETIRRGHPGRICFVFHLFCGAGTLTGDLQSIVIDLQAMYLRLSVF